MEHLHERRLDDALALAVGLIDGGVMVQHVLVDLIGAAQIEVGRRWYDNVYSLSDEHIASGISDTVLTLVSTQDLSRHPRTPHAAVLCPDGEWHTLALRIVGRVFELEEIAVSFLGGSLPSDHLARFLTKARPDLVAISCSTALAFDGVLATVEVAHQHGIPVLAGGSGFGGAERRAHALGVDAWASTAAAGVALARAMPGTLRSPTADSGYAMECALDRPRLVDECVRRLNAAALRHRSRGRGTAKSDSRGRGFDPAACRGSSPRAGRRRLPRVPGMAGPPARGAAVPSLDAVVDDDGARRDRGRRARRPAPPQPLRDQVRSRCWVPQRRS